MLNELATSFTAIMIQTQFNLHALALILTIEWGVFLLNSLVGHRLLYLGIIPRHIYGLPGIIFAPLLHVNFNHIFFNSIPLAVLSNFLLMHGIAYYLLVTAEITLLSGFFIWCFAKPGIHVGASALITGYWGLLVMNSYQQGTVTAIILGVICLYYFAGILFSIFPQEKGVSWEGHLFGLLAGIAVSLL